MGRKSKGACSRYGLQAPFPFQSRDIMHKANWLYFAGNGEAEFQNTHVNGNVKRRNQYDGFGNLRKHIQASCV